MPKSAHSMTRLKGALTCLRVGCSKTGGADAPVVRRRSSGASSARGRRTVPQHEHRRRQAIGPGARNVPGPIEPERTHAEFPESWSRDLRVVRRL